MQNAALVIDNNLEANINPETLLDSEFFQQDSSQYKDDFERVYTKAVDCMFRELTSFYALEPSHFDLRFKRKTDDYLVQSEPWSKITWDILNYSISDNLLPDLKRLIFKPREGDYNLNQEFTILNDNSPIFTFKITRDNLESEFKITIVPLKDDLNVFKVLQTIGKNLSEVFSASNEATIVFKKGIDQTSEKTLLHAESFYNFLEEFENSFEGKNAISLLDSLAALPLKLALIDNQNYDGHLKYSVFLNLDQSGFSLTHTTPSAFFENGFFDFYQIDDKNIHRITPEDKNGFLRVVYHWINLSSENNFNDAKSDPQLVVLNWIKKTIIDIDDKKELEQAKRNIFGSEVESAK